VEESNEVFTGTNFIDLVDNLFHHRGSRIRIVFPPFLVVNFQAAAAASSGVAILKGTFCPACWKARRRRCKEGRNRRVI
jgi:hypothetical protein